MTERIRELWDKAAESTAAYPSGANNSWETQVNFMEKFAELIVQECCQLIDDATPVYSPENLQEDYCQGQLDGYRSALLEIREHFGVEE